MKKIIEGMWQVLNQKPKSNLAAHLQKCNIIESNHKQEVIGSSIQPLSQDYCKSCKQNMCNACADQHIQNHCQMQLATNTNLGVGILRDFNVGVLIKADIRDLRCICGKKLGHDAAICAACGLASCSIECHQCWENQGNCIFHKNFELKKQLNLSLRSILFQNIENIQKANIKQWNPAQRTNLNLIGCYASREKNFVYFQRGYRNYGNPNPQLIERFQHAKMQSMAKFYTENSIASNEQQPYIRKHLRGLDFETHIERICICNCDDCIRRGKNQHSIGNCEYGCQHSIGRAKQIKDINPKNQMQCHCQCDFCRSGIIMDTHRIIDCYFHCFMSNNSQIFQE